MAQEPVVIPEKIYFKIGEVCDLVGVQAHVLRYWETEFSMLSPQKNKSGQRSYRRRDVEIALRIKRLLYNEMFTIAGARKKLQAEARDASNKSKPPTETEPDRSTQERVTAPTLFDTDFEPASSTVQPVSLHDNAPEFSPNQQDALRTVARQLIELRDLLRAPVA